MLYGLESTFSIDIHEQSMNLAGIYIREYLEKEDEAQSRNFV